MQITQLHRQIHAYAEQNALLQSRVQAVLEALEKNRVANSHELNRLEHAQTQLSRQLEVCRVVASEARKEKEEMTEVVLELIRKGGLNRSRTLNRFQPYSTCFVFYHSRVV